MSRRKDSVPDPDDFADPASDVRSDDRVVQIAATRLRRGDALGALRLLAAHSDKDQP